MPESAADEHPNDNKGQQLISKLKELFQLDQPDLDFGLYRIMHAVGADPNLSAPARRKTCTTGWDASRIGVASAVVPNRFGIDETLANGPQSHHAQIDRRCCVGSWPAAGIHDSDK